jgi:hypothetical protein
MIKKHNITGLLIFIFLISGLMVLSTACWGDPTFKIIFENRIDNTLIIYVNDRKVGSVNNNEAIVDDGIPMTLTKFRVEAKNLQDEIIFSKTLTREQMQEIKSRVYKVIIK